MNSTLVAKLLGREEQDFEETKEYFKRVGMTFAHGLKDDLFHIEVRESPAIIDTLKENGYFVEESNSPLDILRISAQGVVLYFSIAEMDGYVFIPKENIISIHTISERFISGILPNNPAAQQLIQPERNQLLFHPQDLDA
jgi:hypothetical protein